MAWLIGAVVLGVAVFWAVRLAGPRVGTEKVADEDQALVRDSDRARWRRTRVSAYRLDKSQDDSYRLAAFRAKVAAGATEAEARAQVRREFPFYYSVPAERDIEGFAGEDGNLPVVLRERVTANARVLKELMRTEGDRFRTMNALVRTCIRKGAL